MRPTLPRLSEAYGLRPVDLDDMTLREVHEYLEQLAELDASTSSTVAVELPPGY